ncbi:MAG: TlpA disulfide reductase family protein [Acidocella sp.]|nr:TlpA disulfide reductase family protein [Acidocella sp.]
MSLLKPTHPSLTRPLTRHLSRRSIIAAATGLAVSAARGNYAHAQISPEDLPDASTGLQQIMPSTAPDLKFTDQTGHPLSLADYRGSGLLVNVWATWCPPCVAELPSIAALAPQLAPFKILVLPVSVDSDGAQAVQPFYKSHSITTLPILLDTDGNAPDLLQSNGIPITVLIDPAGRMVARLEGGANWNTPNSIAAITQLIGTKPVGGNPSGSKPSLSIHPS